MNNEKGITLVSLVIYIAVMIIVLSVMGSIISTFYDNTDGMNGKVEELIKFNKFNISFLKEVKANNNAVDRIETVNGENYILFNSGNTFLFKNSRIYYNNIVLIDGVKNAKFIETEDKNIITVTLDFDSFSKTINYKVENIY